MTCSRHLVPILNLKPSVERFEQRMKFIMIIQRIINVLWKSKLIYSFELIYSHGLVSGITSLSMILPRRPANFLIAVLTKSLIPKKCFCFYQEICFSFLFFLPMPL